MPATVADPNRSLDSEQISPATIAHHTVYEKTPNLHQSHISQWGAQPYLVGPLSRLVGKPPMSPWVSADFLPLTQVVNNTNSAIPLTEIFDRVFSDVCNSLGFEVQEQKKRGSGNNRVYRNLKLLFLTFSAFVANSKKSTLHGGQSRSWSAGQGKKKKVWQRPPPAPPPRCSFEENTRKKITRRINMSRRYASRGYAGGLGPSRVRTRIPTTRRVGQWVSLRKILRFRVRLQLSQSRCLSLLLAMSGRVYSTLFFPPRNNAVFFTIKSVGAWLWILFHGETIRTELLTTSDSW